MSKSGTRAWPGVTFLSVVDQIATYNKYAEARPTRHYATKNIGYLNGMMDKSPLGENATFECPIQRLLADGDSDADVSFRMTDIWRAFVAECCLCATGKSMVFRDATVYQERNERSLIRDLKDDISGYLHNMRAKYYEALVAAEIIPPQEMILLERWLEAVGQLA